MRPIYHRKQIPVGRAALRLLLTLGLLFAAAPARASMSVYMGPGELAERSPLIVEATVSRNASGFDPHQGSVATYITLDIDVVHRGPSDLEQVVLREPGGRYGEIVNEIDSVPVYVEGERVLVFLEAARDGALRTTGMFFGKFSLVETPDGRGREAHRDLEGQGLILNRPTRQVERMRVSDLQSLAAARGPSTRGLATTPPEYQRLVWPEAPASGVIESHAAGTTGLSALTQAAPPVHIGTQFVTLSGTHPARWQEIDSGSSIQFHIERAGDPLGNAPAAVAAIQNGMNEWTAVPESRVVIQPGDDDYDYTGSYGLSPAVSYSGVNVVLFDDPYDDISDPSGCLGVLAIGGYWRSGATGDLINGEEFHPILQGYVIFNNAFECFLGSADNLSEVATHELGHAIGFGHSGATDAIMRSNAYGSRGSRLGDDDRDAAHCVYPHELTLLSPNGGESWEVGNVESIVWDGSEEAGADPGTVDVEYSTDGGQSWQSISTGETHDGSYSWTVPEAIGNDVRLRVIRSNRTGSAPVPFPDACSADASDASFNIIAPVVAGSIPSDSPFQIEKLPGGDVRLSWASSCSGSADGHAVYEGDLENLRTGAWNAVPATCGAGGDLSEELTPQAGNRYFLIVPLAGGTQGTFGSDSIGPRAAPLTTCGVVESSGLACD